MMASPAAIFRLTLLLSLTISFSGGKTPLKLSKTGLQTIYDPSYKENFKFPKDRPYHYANSTKDIPPNFLPVQISTLPAGDGVWVLRHKDFSGLPKRFVQDRNIDTSKSVITFGTTASIFKSVTIKALAFGDVQLDLVLDGGHAKIHGEPYRRKSVTERISLFGQHSPQNCNLTCSKADKQLHWTIFEIETSSNGDFSLEASIPHPKSFLMLDEILIETDFCDLSGSNDHDGFIACLLEATSRKNRLVRCDIVN